MTRLEVIEFYKVPKPVRRSKKWLAVTGLVLALGLFFMQQKGAGAKGWTATCGVLWENFFDQSAATQARSGVSYGVNYKEGQGLSVQATQDFPVKVQVDGATVVTRAAMPRLTDILKNAGVELGPNDRAEAKFSTDTGKLAEIEVIRVRRQVVTESVQITPPVHTVRDYFLAPGTTVVMDNGEPGVTLRKSEVSTENGVEVSRHSISEDILTEARPKVVDCGVATTPADRLTASRSDLLTRTSRVLSVEATAYTHTGSRTASGVYPYVGGVAVDTRVIPLGTRLYIDGYGPAKAVDTGGAIKGQRVDLFFDTKIECLNWGRREVKVYCLQ
jgi:3D (Asp-Asp-Asp) domain-containing protein